MKKLKIIAGLTWAVICLILIFILFPGLDNFSVSASKLPFMKINPSMTGGVVAQRIIEPSCTIDVRKPVFDWLIGERKTGFVQIDWRGKMEEKFSDTIDYNQDKIPDFFIAVDPKSSSTILNAMNDRVTKVEVSTPTSYGWAVRVKLKK
jgi:hypothetical protein